MRNANDIAADILRQKTNSNFTNGMTLNGNIPTMGNGSTMFVGDVKSLAELKDQKAREDFNKSYEDVEANIEQKLAKATEKTENAKKYLDMEVIPWNSYILVRPFKENPFDKIETTNSGIILNPLDGEFHNQDTGESDTKQKLERVAEVIEVNPDCTKLRVGDTIMYRYMQAVPVPFFRQGFEVVSENQILVVINDSLKERLGLL